MIAVDTSALVAVIEQEPEAANIIVELTQSASVISAASWVELHKVMLNRYPATGMAKIKAFMTALPPGHRPRIVALTARQAKAGIEAISRFGHGKYGLNYGDCMSYALAKTLDLPLLYKGQDFTLTDLKKIEAVP
ncbi:MAG: type II toxin-antitoxin system VapC family toxin [Pseudomonadota bacterium]